MKEVLFIMGLIGVILNMVLFIVKHITKAIDPLDRLCDWMPRFWVQGIIMALSCACMVVSQIWF